MNGFPRDSFGDLPRTERVPSAAHLITDGAGPIPWVWSGSGEQSVHCVRKGCTGYFLRVIDAQLSPGSPSYYSDTHPDPIGPGGAVPPCPDQQVDF